MAELKVKLTVKVRWWARAALWVAGLLELLVVKHGVDVEVIPDPPPEHPNCRCVVRSHVHPGVGAPEDVDPLQLAVGAALDAYGKRYNCIRKTWPRGPMVTYESDADYRSRIWATRAVMGEQNVG